MITIADFLGLPSLSKSYLAAGFEGIFQPVQNLEIMEEPYPKVLKFLESGEIILTNFWSMKDDKAGRIALVKHMIKIRCAALGIMPGPHLGNRIDQEIIDLANENSFPILFIDEDVRWKNIISEFGLLTHSQNFTYHDTKLDTSLKCFSDFHVSGNLQDFCDDLSVILGMPLIMTTNRVYSSGNNKLDANVVIAKIQRVCQNHQNMLVSPISIRLNQEYLGIICFGTSSMVVTYTQSSNLGKMDFALFHRLVPYITKELDKLCNFPFYAGITKYHAFPRDTEVYCVLIKKDNIAQITAELDYRYMLYEQNHFLNYCILLIPQTSSAPGDIYHVYHEIMEKVDYTLFAFTRRPMDRKTLAEEMRSLEYMIHFFPYLRGVYSMEEMYLLSLLNQAPNEIRNHLRIQREKGERWPEESIAAFTTLRLYFALENMQAVASLLDIHVNSVKYRMNKAAKLLGYSEEFNSVGRSDMKKFLQLELIAMEGSPEIG